MDYAWYTSLKNSADLQQGDLIPECPIVIPPNSYEQDKIAEIEIKEIDSIVLSQSCDLLHEKLEIVLVCPYYPLRTFIDRLPPDRNKSKEAVRKTIEELQKGNSPGYHLINKDVNCFDDYQVVDFKNVYGIHITTLKALISSIETRYRLLPPYREHLSQAFARYFMRVGLPQDIKIEGY